jgi:Type II/IV secretion system protein
VVSTYTFVLVNAILSVEPFSVFRTWWVLLAALRMQHDRIILDKLRGLEAFTFLRAVNLGHLGSMTNMHTDTPQLAAACTACEGPRGDHGAGCGLLSCGCSVLGEDGGQQHGNRAPLCIGRRAGNSIELLFEVGR